MATEDVVLPLSYAVVENAIVDNVRRDTFPTNSGSNRALRATAESIFATLADAEDANYAFLDDLIDDIFAVRRTTQENERTIHTTVSYAWHQVLDACVIAATESVASLDAVNHHAASLSSGELPQFVRPQVDDEDDSPSIATRARRRRLSRPYEPVLPFLIELWTFIDHRPTFMETQLAQFPSSRFHVSAIPTHGHKGEWQIPAKDLVPFLHRVVSAARLSVLGSIIEYVASTNAAFLEKKANAHSKLHSAHVALCVQTALLMAEKQALGKDISEATVSVFQTEISSELLQDEDNELLVHYDEGVDPPLITIDRNATKSVSHKPALSSTITKKQRQAERIVSLLMPRPQEAGANKWGAVRKRLLVHDNHVGIAVETDMVLTVPMQKTATATKLLAVASKKKASVAATSPTPRAIVPAPSPPRRFSEPDAAALSNIFSLGTPRQLSPDELARRNDLLSLLERDQAKASRRMAVASIISVSLSPVCMEPNGKSISSGHDNVFRAYVEANSSITVTSGSCAVAASPSGESLGEETTVGDPLDQLKRSQAVSDRNNKTRFELALEPPRFEVADGNTPKLWAAAAAAAESKSTKPRRRGEPKSPLCTLDSAVSPKRKDPQPQPPPSHQPHQPHRPQQPVPASHQLQPLDITAGHLPQLSTSRLAMGVKAVVRGVEKCGPRHDPSRNSRVRLHNYTLSPEGDCEDHLPAGSPTRTSPEKREPLPPVSPVKASSHRKHVEFSAETSIPATKYPSPQRPAQEVSSPVPPNGFRRFPVKQPTFEKRTSPPRVRNRHLTEDTQSKSISRNQYARAKWEERNASEDFAAMNAPRRDLAYSKSPMDD